MESGQLTGVCVPSCKQHAGCVTGSGGSYRNPLFSSSLLDELISAPQVSERWLGGVFLNGEEMCCFSSSGLVEEVTVEICRPSYHSHTWLPKTQKELRVIWAFQSILYGLWAMGRFSTSEDSTQCFGQYFFVDGEWVGKFSLRFWLVFLWVLSWNSYLISKEFWHMASDLSTCSPVMLNDKLFLSE